MAEQETDFFFDPSCDQLTAEALQFEPLFIHEEEEGDEERFEEEHFEEQRGDEEERGEEERFEDCVEDLQTALGFSQRCRSAMEEEFSGLMAQMMAEIEEYDSLLHSASMGGCSSLILPGVELTPQGDQQLHTAGGRRRAGGGRSPGGGALVLQGERSPGGGALVLQGERSAGGGALVLQGERSAGGGALVLQGERSAEDTLLQLTGQGDALLPRHMWEEQEQEEQEEQQEQEQEQEEGHTNTGEVCPAANMTAEEVRLALERSPEAAAETTAEVEVVRLDLDLGALGALFEECIEEVGRLERRRDALVSELLEAERPLAEGVQALRAELGHAHKQLQHCDLQKEDLRESMRLLKRQLFAVAKACAQSQMELSSRKHDVQQLGTLQEELQVQFQTLTEEAAQLRSQHQSRLQSLQEQEEEEVQETPAPADLLSPGRRASCDLQQYLQGALCALEEWYEPRLVALLKRREGGQEALRRAKEEAQELRGRLGPLREEHQRLQLQRACLEEKHTLMDHHRRESLDHYKGTVDHLEESSRQLRTELQVQRRKTKEMEALKNSLMEQLCLYRDRTEDYEEAEPQALGDHGNQQPSMVEVQN